MARILLVEDNPVDFEMIRTALEKRAYKVLTATNGKEAINQALNESPDLILLDMILPGMHGLEVAIKLKKLPETEEIPIIAISAVGSTEFINECYQEGVCAFIKKPYQEQNLFEKIEKFMRTQRKTEKKKVLIIDEDPAEVTLLTMSLLRHGYKVLSASDGKEGVKLVLSEKPDLILSDVMMPKMSGWETFDKIKENPSWNNIPVVFLTARTDRIAKNAGSFLGEDYIEKPFEIDELKRRIDEIINS